MGRRQRRLGAAAALHWTRRQCANGPAPMGIRSAIAVESRVTSSKLSPPAHRRFQTQNRQDRGMRSPRSAAVGVPAVARSSRRAAPPPVRSRRSRRIRPDEIGCRSGDRCQGRTPATARVGGLEATGWPPCAAERSRALTNGVRRGRSARRAAGHTRSPIARPVIARRNPCRAEPEATSVRFSPDVCQGSRAVPNAR
jgi:hypothetical protein